MQAQRGGFRKARFSVLEGEISILDAMGGRCGGRGRRNDRGVGIYSLLVGVKIVVFGCLFFNDFEMILGYLLGYHFSENE